MIAYSRTLSWIFRIDSTIFFAHTVSWERCDDSGMGFLLDNDR